MVRKKFNAEAQEAAAKERIKNFKTIEEQWFIEEVTPGYNTGGYYDQDVPEKAVRVSDFFIEKDLAIKWMDDHEPDKGKTLRLRRRRLVERTFREWVSY